MAQDVLEALRFVMGLLAEDLCECYAAEDQTVASAERAAALIRTHADLAFAAGSYRRFPDGFDPLRVVRRLGGAGRLGEVRRQAAELLELRLAAERAA